MSFSKRLYEQQPSVADRLENARSRVRFALCCADDGKPTFATLDEISRALVAATSDLSALAAELGTHMSERMVTR
jgi:hypothetical protein